MTIVRLVLLIMLVAVFVIAARTLWATRKSLRRRPRR